MIDLLIVVVFSLLMGPVALVADGAPQVVLGLPFVLFFPGYGLVSALFPRRGAFDGIERVALGFGLSLAMVPLIGLVLNYSPWGIRPIPIGLSLLLVILVLVGVAGFRRRALPQSERFEVDLRGHLSRLTLGWRTGGIWDKVLVGLLLLAIVGAIGATVYRVRSPNDNEKFTEFYILGPEGKAEGYPTDLVVGQAGTVLLGIVNHEHATVTYRTEVTIDGEEVEALPAITLDAKEKWENAITFTPTHPGEKQKAEFDLYKGDADKPYETVHLWVDVSQLPGGG